MKEYKQEINITDKLQARLDELISRYPADKRKSAMLPVLHEVQQAHDNWMSTELMFKVAEILEVKPIEIFEVVTFYSMFNIKPVGKYMLEFCRTSCCGLRRGDEIMDYTCEKLAVKMGETTTDGMFTVVGVECLGACGYGPMLKLGNFYHEHLTEEKIDTLLEDCKQGKIQLY